MYTDNLDLTTILWIGVFATLVLTFPRVAGIFKGKPKIEVECEPMVRDPSPPGFTRRFSAQMAIKVTNKGDEPVLITGIEYHIYFNWWAKFKQKPYVTIVAGVVTTNPLPWRLEPKQIWEGVGQQPPGFKGRAGAYCVVMVNGSKNGIQCRMEL